MIKTTIRALHGIPKVPKFTNEGFQTYPPNSEERANLLAECQRIRDLGVQEIPCVVNGVEHFTGNVKEFGIPSDNKNIYFRVHMATKELLEEAVEGALEAQKKWAALPQEQRNSVYLALADRVATVERDTMNAVTMLNIGKTMWESEIDIAEMVDFFRFNPWYAEKMYKQQPEHNTATVWNKLEYRPLEGYVASISPFNFISLSTQLACTPCLMGNVSVWRPSTAAALSAYYHYQLLADNGFPEGVIQFVPCDSSLYEEVVLKNPDMAGIHFTGSTGVFNHFWKLIGDNIDTYKSYPKIVGETGGKNFHVLHESGNVDNFIYTTLRGSFDYSGQKCSATSRAYIPRDMWPEIRDRMVEITKDLKVGQPDDPESYLSAVIDGKSFENIKGFFERAEADPNVSLVVGGGLDDTVGWFVEPTIFLTEDPHADCIENEIFGPVLSIYLYDSFDEVLDIVDETSIYALTGAVYANDRYAIQEALDRLKYSCGNMNINDKSTGAQCGQQLFGGARKSGTNDKTGSWMGLQRWVTPRTIKEQFRNLNGIYYPSNLPDVE